MTTQIFRPLSFIFPFLFFGCSGTTEDKQERNLYAAENMLRSDSLYVTYPALHAIDYSHYDSLLNLDYTKISFANQCFFAIAFFEAEYDLRKNRHDSLYKVIEPLIDSIIEYQDSLSHKHDLELPLALLGAKLSGDQLLGKFSGSSSASFSIEATILIGTRPIYSMILDAKSHYNNTDDHSWPLMIDSAFNRYVLRIQIPIMEQLYANYLETKGDTLESISLREKLIASGVYVFTNCDKVISYYTSKQDWNKVASYIALCKQREFEYRIPALIPYYLFKGDTAYAIELLKQSVEDTTVYKSNITARLQITELYIRTGKYVEAEKLIESFPFSIPIPYWPEPYTGFNYNSYRRHMLLKFCRYNILDDTQGMQRTGWEFGMALDQMEMDAVELLEQPLRWY